MAKTLDAAGLFDDPLSAESAKDQPAEQSAEQSAEHAEAKSATELEPSFLDSMDFKGPIIFDIETGPLADADLEAFFEFDPTRVKGYDLLDCEFDESSVRYGNTKDEAKRSEKLEAARKAFIASQLEAKRVFETAEQDAFEAFRDRAALDARTCRVLTVAYMDAPTGRKILDDGGDHEGQLLTTFWEFFAYCRAKNIRIIGFNSTSFDVPVLARRAMFHHIPLPTFRNGRYLDKTFIDLRDVWACGEWQPKGTLDSLSTFFGGPEKNGSGADFHKLWNGTDEQHNQAVEYALNDLDMTLAVAKGVQVI